ncbi:unnamed protein product [Rodentolepis nana]|uniref:Protein FAR1-RELATED SEQUENCE n=1 Tax=Rodentolepis nana TaxID=102285 RepID=A0A0R3TTY2_RODNA|nr:unnamed protein product [Rodentolepis nana]
MKDYKVIERVTNETEKALLLRRLILSCNKDLLLGCSASIELGRNGDVLKVFKFDDHHNHDVMENTCFPSFIKASQESFGRCQNGYVRKVFSYPSVGRKVIYDQCAQKFCTSYYSLLQKGSNLRIIRGDPSHVHGAESPIGEQHEEIKPRNVEFNYYIFFEKALDVIGNGLMAKDEQEIEMAATEFIVLLYKFADYF